MLVACNQTKETNMDYTDDVKTALANDGHIDLNRMEWTREPERFEVNGETIRITTKPHTDLWQRTYYHFRNDNAPVLQMKTRERFFSFVVKTDFAESHQRFDQCGIVMYLDSENWLKGSVEYENEQFQHLGSVVTNGGYSDWATTEIKAGVKTMWYRFSRREDDYCIAFQSDAYLSHACGCRRDTIRHLCLFTGRVVVYGCVLKHEDHRMCMACSRWSAA